MDKPLLKIWWKDPEGTPQLWATVGLYLTPWGEKRYAYSQGLSPRTHSLPGKGSLEEALGEVFLQLEAFSCLAKGDTLEIEVLDEEEKG